MKFLVDEMPYYWDECPFYDDGICSPKDEKCSYISERKIPFDTDINECLLLKKF